MNGWIAIFRAGTHTDSSGHTREFSRADLDHLISRYDAKHHEAPLVIGHPQTDSPAFGWVKKLKRKGETLLAKFKQVPVELKEAVRAGHYKKVSVALYPDITLRHVGLLGAMPPAVKGLGSVSFGDGADWHSFEFADLEPKPAPNQEDDDMPTQEEMDRLRREKEAAEAKAQAAEADARKAGEEKAAADQRAQAAEAAKEKAEKEFAEHRAKEAAQAREARFAALVKDDKVLPADKATVMAFAEAVARDGRDLTFSENGQETKQPLEEALWRFLEAQPARGLLGEFAQEPGGSGEDKPVGATQVATKL